MASWLPIPGSFKRLRADPSVPGTSSLRSLTPKKVFPTGLKELHDPEVAVVE
jgi:hypothetical protein